MSLEQATKPPQYAVPRSPHWPAVQKAHLEKHPTCAACGGDKHLNVHHVKPYHIHPELELVEANLITLCESPTRLCHFRKGHFFEWASWNVNVRREAAKELKEIQNRPRGGK